MAHQWSCRCSYHTADACCLWAGLCHHQAGILSGKGGEEAEGVIVLDVAPLSMGIETVGGVMTKVIPRNSRIPITRSQLFTTYQDKQTSVSIQVTTY